MVSKPVMFILLGAACVAAAGGGAYIATWQHERATAPAVTPVTDQTPQTVAVGGSTAPTNQPPQSAPEPAVQASDSAVPPAVAEPSPRAPVAAAKRAGRSARPTTPVPAAVARPAAPAPTDGAQPVQAAPPPLPPPAADNATPAARPGAAAPVVPMIIDPAAESARADQDAASRGPEKQWEEVVVPAESVIGLQLESSISSEFARVEDRVDARVTRDVRVGSRVAIPAGTRAIGTVVLVERGGKVKERARLGLRFNTLILPDTTRLTVNTETIYREGESPAAQSTAKIGGAAIGGAIIGAILGGGKGAAIGSGLGAAGGTAVTMNGDRLPVSLAAGTPLSVRTQAPINMTVEK